MPLPPLPLPLPLPLHTGTHKYLSLGIAAASDRRAHTPNTVRGLQRWGEEEEVAVGGPAVVGGRGRRKLQWVGGRVQNIL